MNLSTYKNIIKHKTMFYFDNATGLGTPDVDTNIQRNPNDFLAPLVGSKDELIKILTIVALALSIWVSILVISKNYSK